MIWNRVGEMEGLGLFVVWDEEKVEEYLGVEMLKKKVKLRK